MQSFLEDTCEDHKCGDKRCLFLEPFRTGFGIPASPQKHSVNSSLRLAAAHQFYLASSYQSWIFVTPVTLLKLYKENTSFRWFDATLSIFVLFRKVLLTFPAFRRGAGQGVLICIRSKSKRLFITHI